MFCKMPGLFFHLEGRTKLSDPYVDPGNANPRDLSQIPDDWILKEVGMTRISEHDSFWKCLKQGEQIH